MTYRNVNNTRLGAEADLSLVCYSINYQLTFLLFQESVDRIVNRIALNEGINNNSSLYPKTPKNDNNGRCHRLYRDWFCCLLWPALDDLLELVLGRAVGDGGGRAREFWGPLATIRNQ